MKSIDKDIKTPVSLRLFASSSRNMIGSGWHQLDLFFWGPILAGIESVVSNATPSTVGIKVHWVPHHIGSPSSLYRILSHLGCVVIGFGLNGFIDVILHVLLWVLIGFTQQCFVLFNDSADARVTLTSHTVARSASTFLMQEIFQVVLSKTLIICH